MSLEIKDKVTNEFLLKYQDELLKRAETIGLMNHSSTNGMLKEFLIKSVLESILPSTCSIKTGIIIDGKGNKSKQIDIIIYDNRVPKLELSEGIGFYFIEGVIATIEVKSNLNKNEITASLDNCYSVLNLESIVSGRPKIAKGDDWIVPTNKNEIINALFQHKQAAYIFSFDSISMKIAYKHVIEWFESCEVEPIRNGIAMLPRAILGKNWIGLLDDEYIQIPNEIKIKSKTGNSMVFIETENSFSFFISHILTKISKRIKASQGVNDCYFSIHEYLPLKRFLENDQNKKEYLIF